MTVMAVVCHKPYTVPQHPPYLPVMAGASLNDRIPEGFVRDDSGDNISERNPTFSELTAVYWLWKNKDSLCSGTDSIDSIGICHYRRYFMSGKGRSRHLLRAEEIGSLLERFDVILPSHRNYVIETNYSHYIHSHHACDLDITREIISERCPSYLSAFDTRMAMRTGHRFNMAVMKADDFDRYCEWLFDILFELERRLDISGYEGRDRRVFGLVSERLLDVWIDANGLTYTELPYKMTEPEHIALKGIKMIIRKLRAAAASGRKSNNE